MEDLELSKAKEFLDTLQIPTEGSRRMAIQEGSGQKSGEESNEC